MLVCSTFSAVGAVVLRLLFWAEAETAEAGLVPGLWLRAAFFSLAALGAGIMLWRIAGKLGLGAPEAQMPKTARAAWPGLIAALVFTALLVFPRLDAWPWAAPDETHHLIVAKNLAQKGLYASGSEATGYTLFDPFDSVGPPVIAAAAAAFKMAGVSLAAGRAVIGLHLIGLCIVLFLLCRKTFGTTEAVAAAFFAPMAFSTIYLSRALYGEVPALFWFLTGLLLWRTAMDRAAWHWAALLAGAAFALAVLCKTILLLSAFAFFGAWVYDRLCWKRIKAGHVLLPAVGAALVFLLWWGYQGRFDTEAANAAGGTLALYRHYLLFGLEPVWKNLNTWWWDYPLAHLFTAAAVIAVVPQVFGRRYDPAWVVLFLSAVFYAFWWTCFTPGQLPRYLWYSDLIMGAFSAVLYIRLLRAARDSRPLWRRAAMLAAALALLVSPLHWTHTQVRAAATNSEMRDDLAVAECIGRFPATARIATPYYPMAGTLRFLCDRVPEVVEAAEDVTHYDVAILTEYDPLPEERPWLEHFGRFVVWAKRSPQ